MTSSTTLNNDKKLIATYSSWPTQSQCDGGAGTQRVAVKRPGRPSVESISCCPDEYELPAVVVRLWHGRRITYLLSPRLMRRTPTGGEWLGRKRGGQRRDDALARGGGCGSRAPRRSFGQTWRGPDPKRQARPQPAGPGAARAGRAGHRSWALQGG